MAGIPGLGAYGLGVAGTSLTEEDRRHDSMMRRHVWRLNPGRMQAVSMTCGPHSSARLVTLASVRSRRRSLSLKSSFLSGLQGIQA